MVDNTLLSIALSLAVIGVSNTGEIIALRAGLGIAAAAMAPITNSLVFRLFDDQALRMRVMTDSTCRVPCSASSRSGSPATR